MSERVDMSPRAIAARLAELRALCLLARSLRDARRVGTPAAPSLPDPTPRDELVDEMTMDRRDPRT